MNVLISLDSKFKTIKTAVTILCLHISLCPKKTVVPNFGDNFVKS